MFGNSDTKVLSSFIPTMLNTLSITTFYKISHDVPTVHRDVHVNKSCQTKLACDCKKGIG